MYVGTQLSSEQYAIFGQEYLRQLAQLGVKHVSVDPLGPAKNWDRDCLLKHLEVIDNCGLILDMIQLPMTSHPIEKSESKHIMLGKNPERDREIDLICELIEMLSEVGVGAVRYNCNLIGIPRTEDEIGRGGSRHSTYREDKLVNFDELSEAGHVNEDLFWERIEYFLDRVVPVATANKVRMACHPHDPLTPVGYRGVTRVLGDADGLKRFVSFQESDYHGLNFCQGTIAESMINPKEEMPAVIKWFGERGKIHNVHFRNIIGGRGSFMEVFLDNGDMDMTQSFKQYQDVGYKYMIMPDHVPHIDGKAPFETGFAFCIGYIIALFQANGLDPY